VDSFDSGVRSCYGVVLDHSLGGKMEAKEQEARGRVGKAKKAFIDAEDVMVQIIYYQDWLPLGYRSFLEMFDAEFEGVTFAQAVKNLIIYTMLNDGVGVRKIAKATRTSDRKVIALDQQRRAGVHYSKSPVPKTTHSVKIPDDLYGALFDAAQLEGSSLTKVTNRALKVWLETNYPDLIKLNVKK
jgi:hypothetical protein